MSVPALLQSLRHGEGFSKLPASFGIMQFRTSKGRTYLALSIVLQVNFTKSWITIAYRRWFRYCTALHSLFPSRRWQPSRQSAINFRRQCHSHIRTCHCRNGKGKTFRFCSCKWRKVVRKVGASAYRHNGFNFNFSICRNKASILQSMVLLELLERKLSSPQNK